MDREGRDQKDRRTLDRGDLWGHPLAAETLVRDDDGMDQNLCSDGICKVLR